MVARWVTPMSGRARLYRLPLPYRSRRLYDGSDTALPVAQINNRVHYRLMWDTQTARATSASIVLHRPGKHGLHLQAPWGTGAANSDSLALPLVDLDPHGTGTTLPWDAQSARSRFASLPSRQPAAQGDAATLRWGDLQLHPSASDSLVFRSPTARSTQAALPWGTLAAHALASSALWRAAAARGAMVALPWGPMGRRQNDVLIPWPVETDPEPGAITIPTLPVYVMLPTLSAVRLPDRTPLKLLSISLETDRDSWAWSFSAPIAYADLALIGTAGDPVDIEVAINGHVWTFAVDGYDDNRKFGSRTATLRGKSRSAELAAPRAPVRTYTQGADRTAAQLAEEELDGSGWTLVWDAVDWLVPGGTFGYQDLAPIDAIAQLAAAVGATLASDPEDKTLTVAPAYTDSPWAWSSATPYAILPASILTTGDSSWQGGSNADGIYVYAENAATGALVKLTGSAGDQQLPMVVERLLVHTDAIGERGRIELAKAGKRRTVTRTLPVFPSPPPAGFDDLGVVPVGALVTVEDTDETWRGLVTGVRVEANRSGTALSVRQHLSIERQYR